MCNKTWSSSRCDTNFNLLLGDVHKENFAGENSCGVQSIATIKMCVKLCDLWMLRNPELGFFGLVSKARRNV